jgi:hypothetical protein
VLGVFGFFVKITVLQMRNCSIFLELS